MSQLKIKQVNGLQTALDGKVGSGSNQGGAQGVFKQKSGTALQFYTLGSAGSVIPQSPASDIINFILSFANIPNEITTLQGTDRIAVMDDSDSDEVKWMSITNLQSEVSGGSGPVDFTDYTADTSVSGDSIIFFDASDSDNPNIETKSSFLSAYATLASPTFTGTPAAPTAAIGTNTTQLATTAFVQQALAATSAGFSFLDSINNVQVDNTLDPGATPTSGDRYIITNAASLHANFGTINADTEGNATTLANNDVVEYSGSTFKILFDASEQGEGAFTYNESDNKLWVFTTSWNAMDTAETTAGDGLTKTGTDFDVNVSGVTTDIIADQVVVKSSGTAGQVLRSAGSGEAAWGAVDLDDGDAVTGTLGVANGGLNLSTVPANSVLATDGSTDNVTALAVAASRFVGRKSSGNVAALTKTEALTELGSRRVFDVGTLTAASMTLATLSQTPDAAGDVKVFINGVLLKYTTDYTISGTTVTATNALNAAYGGSGSDGNGFESDDVIQAVYTY